MAKLLPWKTKKEAIINFPEHRACFADFSPGCDTPVGR
jgi:hypothetical protein